jgi:pimeloyl-ACP methyl ester carboxylesterase
MLASRSRFWLRASAAFLLLATAGGVVFYFRPLQVNDAFIRYRLWKAHVRSHYVLVDGYDLHYFEAPPTFGSGPGIPLLLIHGLGSRGEDWAPMIPALATQGFHVYAPDLLGFGRSPQPDVDYSISLQERTVVDFMQAVHLAHADVGGWSMGGWVALKLTADHPALVDRLMVYDSAGIYFPPTFEASLFVPTDGAGLTRLSEQLSPVAKPLPAFVQRAAIARLDSYRMPIERSVAAMENGHDLLDFRLYRIAKPTLIVWGSLDHLIPVSVGEEMHRDIPGSSLLLIPGCGHLAPSECSAPVLKGTIDFLKSPPLEESLDRRAGGKLHHTE